MQNLKRKIFNKINFEFWAVVLRFSFYALRFHIEN